MTTCIITTCSSLAYPPIAPYPMSPDADWKIKLVARTAGKYFSRAVREPSVCAGMPARCLMTEMHIFWMHLTPPYPESTNAKGGIYFKVLQSTMADFRVTCSQRKNLSQIDVRSLSDRLRCTIRVPAKARMGDSNV